MDDDDDDDDDDDGRDDDDDDDDDVDVVVVVVAHFAHLPHSLDPRSIAHSSPLFPSYTAAPLILSPSPPTARPPPTPLLIGAIASSIAIGIAIITIIIRLPRRTCNEMQMRV